MNINIKPTCDRNPFDQSDRGGFHKNAGKGDAPRNIGKKFHENFPRSMGKGGFKRFRKVYR